MITVDESQLKRAEELLKDIPNGVNKAIVNAVNRAAQGARTDAVKKARERYYVKAKDVRKTIELKRATYENQAAIVRAEGSPLALSKFRITPRQPPARRRKKPVKAKVLRGGGGGEIPGAFVAQMESGHIGVFVRAGKPRLPIKEKFGPSVPQMLEHESVTEYVEERAREILEQRFEHELNRLLRGVGR